jgi:hypothetical protein
MSLPAGASITSIGGKRCTAIPRVAAAVNTSSNFSVTPAAAAVAATSPAAAAVALANSSTVQAVVGSSSSNVPVAAAAVEPSISQSSSVPAALLTSTQSAISTPSTSNPDANQAIVPTTTSATDQVVAAPQSVLSTPTPTYSPITSPKHASNARATIVGTDSSLTQIPTSQSVYSNQPMASNQAVATTIGHNYPTQAGEGPSQSSGMAVASMSSSSKANIGSVMGGITGGVALIGILAFLWWRCIKRRKSRDSLLTPLNGSFDRRGEKYEIDGDSLGPTPLGKRWKAQAGGFCSRLRMDLVDWGSAVKSKFARRSDAPSVNMNRGNSQFLEPIQQHSRTNSAATGGHEAILTTRDRLADWWQRLTEDVNFNWRLRQKANDPLDHFTATRNMSDREAQRNHVSPSFSQFLVMKDHELRQATERHRRSQSTVTLPQLGSLGLEFNSMSNPFADPFPNVQPTIPNISKPPGALTSNPFANPISKSNSSDYVSNVRRSRGLSQPVPKNPGPTTRLSSHTGVKATNASRHPSVTAPSSRYPSTIRTSQDTYRDTVLSALSISGRNVKGRSDPFDLDRPDLLQRPPPIPSQSQAENVGSSKAVAMQPRIESVHAGKPRIVSHAETYSSSKYSSGVSATFSEWGDPGPDLGPVAWRRPGAEERSIGSNEATRGSVGSGQGSQIITVGRAL